LVRGIKSGTPFPGSNLCFGKEILGCSSRAFDLHSAREEQLKLIYRVCHAFRNAPPSDARAWRLKALVDDLSELS
jgi:hypothetical protein